MKLKDIGAELGGVSVERARQLVGIGGRERAKIERGIPIYFSTRIK